MATWDPLSSTVAQGATRISKPVFVVLQMDDVRLPMVSGAMDDISQEGESSQDGDTPLDSMSSQVMILCHWSLQYLRVYLYDNNLI